MSAATVFVLVPAIALAQARHVETGFLDRTVVLAGAAHRFSVYVPPNFSVNTSWPVLVDLHGNGAQGDDGIRQTAHFLGEEIRLERGRFPLIIVFPRAARGTTWRTPEMQAMVMREIDQATAEFHGDRARTYLSGFSMGATGVYAIAARWPERFAALIAIGGAGPAGDGKRSDDSVTSRYGCFTAPTMNACRSSWRDGWRGS
jgi:predicted peptidase